MPESSIVIKASDRYSDALKAMAKTAMAFTKDADSLEEGLYALNKITPAVSVQSVPFSRSLQETPSFSSAAVLTGCGRNVTINTSKSLGREIG